MASTSMSAGSNNRPPDQLDNEDDRSRLRVSKACTRCRARKDRCDGLTPCTACRNANKPCAYEATTKKRGLPEGYVRSLEKLITLASNTVEGLEDVLVGYLRDDEVKKDWNSPAGDELYTHWKESGVHQELEIFLQSAASSTNTGKRKRTSEDDQSESPAERLNVMLELLRERRYHVAEGDGGERNGNSEDCIGVGTVTSLPSGTGTTTAFPANSKDLLDLYFTHVHPWFPVLNRPAVLKAFYGQMRRAPETAIKPDGGRALIWSIFAYAVVIDNSSAEDMAELSRDYSEVSLKHIPTPYTNAEDVSDFGEMHAQALLILALLRLGNGQWLGSWMCTARSVRILLAKRSPSAKGVLQGCFILETLLNVHFNNSHSLCPPTLVGEMIDEDGHEEWESWGGHQHAGHNEPSFALSVFNRLTKVFMILHEALADPEAAKSPIYIQAKLEAIHGLAQEHFNAGINSPSLHSPPHHVYFQIGLLFAQLRLVTSVSREARTQFEVTSLATNVLGLFEICEKSHIGLVRVPPLFADILNLAIEVASQIRNQSAMSAASPSHQDVISTISRFRSELTTTWASYRSTTYKEDMEVTLFGESPNTSLGAPQTINYDLEPLPAPVAAANHRTSNRRTPQQQMPSLASPAYSRNSFSQNNWPVVPQLQQFGSAFPVTSPSFQGDEVDAIFHEMAHLDTNEWMNERAMGLKDFGFTDESAFMDFCNDPERLAIPLEAANIPLSSSRQSWTFATPQPP